MTDPETKVPDAADTTAAAEVGEATQCEATAENAAPAAGDAVPAAGDAAPAAEDAAPAAESTETVAETPVKAPQTKSEVIARLKEIVSEAGNVERSEIESLKQTYYKIRNAEVSAARDAFLADGGNADDFLPPADADEETFKAQMALVREQRAQAFAQQEQERKNNLARKQAIIERIKEMAASPDTADKAYNEFKQLQAEWKEVGSVPAEQLTELWKNYQHNVEQFYDQLRLNHEFRAYDFKKNLEIKTHLCEAAEKLAELPDVVSAFHQLQKLHQEYREAGPVAKELREDIWTRFKTASTVINKRHQAHFEQLKAMEEENLVKKTALCEQVEALAQSECKSQADWEKVTRQILELQTQWKGIGFTPKKDNARVFEQFRAACDKFFQAKSEHFKGLRQTYAANLAAKNALCEQAEALKDSTEWTATANRLIQLQKEWKAIGPVAHKASDAVWKRFNEACNAFFERKAQATAGQHAEETANLERKQAVIDRLAALLETPGDDARSAVRELMDEWNAIGHVPFKQKDKVYKAYRETVDKLFDTLHMSAGRRRVESFRRNVADKEGNELTRERSRLFGAYESKKSEIQTYENNLTFLSAKSKSGNSLVDELNKKVERLRTDLDEIRQKIEAIDEQIKAADAADKAGEPAQA